MAAGKETPEAAPTRELEVVPTAGTPELNQASINAMITFSEKTDQIGKALDKIRTFMLGRALSGDWVRFGDKLELSGPASERIVSALGLMNVPVSFEGWHYRKDTGSDKNGDWFTWWYWCDRVTIGGLCLGLVEARASSRDKFFGYESGGYKDLGDVKEHDIRFAARRGVFKEAIKVALGLRSIPVESAASLGLDPAKIKTVEYGNKGGGSGAVAAKAGTPIVIKDVKQRNTKSDGSGKTVYVVIDEKDAKYETFSETLAKAAGELKGKKALLDYEPSENPRWAPKLKGVKAAPAEQPSQPKTDPDAPGDAQEPA